MNSKIGSIEAICLVLILIVNHIVLNLPKNILDLCGSSSILNVLYLAVLIFILCALVIHLFKNFKNSDILDISEFLGGKVLKTIIGILYIGFFVFICATLLRNFSEGLKLTYFPKTPIAIILLGFLLVATIANRFGSKVVIKCNLIIVPLMIVSLLLTFLAVSPRFDFHRVFPIFGYGMNETFFYGITNLFSYSGLTYLFFLMPMLEKKDNFKKITFISIGITAVLLLFSIASLLLALSFVTNIHELTPVYLLVRAAKFGRFVQRPEAIFIFIWVLAFMSYLSVNILFILNIVKKLTNAKSTKAIAPCIASIIFGLSLFSKDMAETKFWEYDIYKYFSLGLVFIVSFTILILAHFKYKKTHPDIASGGDDHA